MNEFGSAVFQFVREGDDCYSELLHCLRNVLPTVKHLLRKNPTYLKLIYMRISQLIHQLPVSNESKLVKYIISNSSELNVLTSYLNFSCSSHLLFPHFRLSNKSLHKCKEFGLCHFKQWNLCQNFGKNDTTQTFEIPYVTFGNMRKCRHMCIFCFKIYVLASFRCFVENSYRVQPNLRTESFYLPLRLSYEESSLYCCNCHIQKLFSGCNTSFQSEYRVYTPSVLSEKYKPHIICVECFQNLTKQCFFSDVLCTVCQSNSI